MFSKPSKQIKKELFDPLYIFQFEDNEPVKVPIADGTKYDEAKCIIKDKFDELKDVDDERIIFEVENKEVDYDFEFSPDVPQDDPIVVKVIDPSYSWKVLENSEDKGVYTDFTFPIEFTVADAIKQIEEEFENKCSVSIIEKNNKKGKGIKFDKKINIYEEFYGKFNICVLKRDIKYAFSADGAPDIKKRFNMNDKIGQIAKFLAYNSNEKTFSFSKEEEIVSHVPENCLVFTYKGKEYSFDDEFKKLYYNLREKDVILISFYADSEIESKNVFIGEDDEKFHIIIDRIGEGSTAVTFKIFDFRTNRTMCKKVIKFDHKKTFKDLQNAIKEFEFLYSIHHPCICIAYGINTCEVIKNEMNKEMTTVAIFLEHLEYSLSD